MNSLRAEPRWNKELQMKILISIAHEKTQTRTLRPEPPRPTKASDI